MIDTISRLACPECRGAIEQSAPNALRCAGCGKSFRYRDGIPYMLDERDGAFEKTRYAEGGTGRLAWIKNNVLFQGYLRLMDALTPFDRYHPLRYMPILKSFLATKRTDKPWFVLDVGGGDGRYREHFARAKDEYAILEVDENSERVRDNKNGLRYIIGDAHRMPVGDGKVDLLAVTEVLEHVYNPFDVVKECARVLRPGGVIFVTTPQYWHIHGWPSDYYRYTIYGLRHLLTTNGLKPVREIPRGGPFTLINIMLLVNFERFFMFPPIRLFVTIPFIWICSMLDGIFFKDVLSRKNPDTTGWIVIAEKE